MITINVYKNTDTPADVELRSDGVAQDISASTRMTLKLADNVVIDSRQETSSMDWTSYGADGHLVLKLGTLDKIVALRPAKYVTRLTVYDLTYPRGLVWGDLVIKVEE